MTMLSKEMLPNGMRGEEIRGYSAIVEVFGLPPSDPKAREGWEKENLVKVAIPFRMTVKNPFTKKQADKLQLSWDTGSDVNSFRIHRKLFDVARLTFESIQAQGLDVLIQNFGGSYAYRPIRGGTSLSTHSFGIAFDINPNTNKLGKVPQMPAALVEAIEDFGWVWGGRWKRPDGMHFQFASGY